MLDTPSQTITAARLATRRGQDTTRTAEPPLLNPARREPAASRYQPRGPVEQRLNQLSIGNDILLQRARAIDTAGRNLITQARAEASQAKSNHQAAKSSQPDTTGPDHSQAAQNFPLKPARPATGRPATGSSRPTRPASARPPGQQQR